MGGITRRSTNTKQQQANTNKEELGQGGEGKRYEAGNKESRRRKGAEFQGMTENEGKKSRESGRRCRILEEEKGKAVLHVGI